MKWEIKEDFHKKLASLPIEKKIKIVMDLQKIDYQLKPLTWKKRMMWKIK